MKYFVKGIIPEGFIGDVVLKQIEADIFVLIPSGGAEDYLFIGESLFYSKPIIVLGEFKVPTAYEKKVKVYSSLKEYQGEGGEDSQDLKDIIEALLVVLAHFIPKEFYTSEGLEYDIDYKMVKDFVSKNKLYVEKLNSGDFYVKISKREGFSVLKGVRK